ncbi:MAG TPA: DNA topoisomerase VI subunit B [Archaeoglobaceae archaeon]|nr:DNA topoisomerase VI subunit B [Archaeoglobaceae archaeon]
MIAEELAKKQREISIAEFFEKNKHVLGYSNPSKSLITCVREAVENSIDACEDARILPDIFIKIDKNDHLKIVVEDNGPGIVKEQIPKIFGKLLYGSRFHAIRQSRGQQGIGISGAILYSQLTTGKPAVITSKTSPEKKACRVELYINTRSNEPEIVKEDYIDWYRARGTRIELEVEGIYVKERKQSVLEYLKETSVVNPHTKITFIDPEGEIYEFNRVSEELPEPIKEIKPHPHGIELGTLMAMLKQTEAGSLKSFLKREFVRIGDKTAHEVLEKAGTEGSRNPKKLNREEISSLLQAFKNTDFLPPPTDCLSPIGEKMIMKSLLSEYRGEWVYAVTRKPKVYSGHPFLVEAGIAYGGEISSEKMILLRYANKIPLLYQQGGCAITKAVESISWRNYGLQQSKGELPVCPAVLMVHVASTNVPYTSESKEAVSYIPEIVEEIRLALQELGRKLKEYVERKEKLKKKKKKEDVLNAILPLLAKKVCEILEKDEIDVEKIVARIIGKVHIERTVNEKDGYREVNLRISNFTRAKKDVKIYEICSGEVDAPSARISQSSYTTVKWELSLNPEDTAVIDYRTRGKIVNKKPLIEGLEESEISGGEVFSLN